MLKTMDDWKHLKAHERAVLIGIFVPTNPLRMLSDSMAQLQNVGGNPALASSFSHLQETITANPALRALSEAEEGAQPTVALLELQNHFYLHLARIRASIFSALVAGGYYARRPDQIQLLYAAKGILAGVVMAVAGSLLARATGMVPWPLTLAGILTGVILVSGKLLSPRTTAAGSHRSARFGASKISSSAWRKVRLSSSIGHLNSSRNTCLTPWRSVLRRNGLRSLATLPCPRRNGTNARTAATFSPRTSSTTSLGCRSKQEAC